MSHRHHHRAAADEKAKKLARKLELHDFTNEDGDEYGASEFGGLKDYKARKRRKLHTQSAHLHATSPSAHPRLFHNHAIHITGHTVPPARELTTLITTHGGLFIPHLDSKTMATHIVASNLPPKKRQELARYRVVRPEWIVDSVAAGKVRPWAEYRLWEAPGQGKLAFGSPSGSGGGAASQKTDGTSSRKGEDGWPASSLSRSMTIPASDGEEELYSDMDMEIDVDVDEEAALQPPTTAAAPTTPTPTAAKPAPITTINGTPLWSADRIIGRRTHRRHTQYWIRWTGYPDTEATWESSRHLLRDLGKAGLAELVQEWRGRPQRRVGRAEVLREVPREVLMVFTAAREGFPRDYGVGEVEAAFVGEEEVGEAEEGGKAAVMEEDLYREIRESLSPRNLMTEEDELALLQGSIFSDGHLSAPATDGTPTPWQNPIASDTAPAPAPVPSSPAVPADLLQSISISTSSDINLNPTPPAAAAAVEKAAETPTTTTPTKGPPGSSSQVGAVDKAKAAETPPPIPSSGSVQVSRSFDYGSPVDFGALVGEQEVLGGKVLGEEGEEEKEEEGGAASFNFGTPVDFADGDIGMVVMQADPVGVVVVGEDVVDGGVVGGEGVPGEIGELVGKESIPAEEVVDLVSEEEEERGSTPRNPDSSQVVDEEAVASEIEEGVFTTDGDGDIQMSQAELLTPRKELEEYDARIYDDDILLEAPAAALGSPPERELLSEHLSPEQHSPDIPEPDILEPEEEEEQEIDVDVEPPPPDQATTKDAPPQQQQPSQELMATFLSKPGIRSQTVLDPNFLNSYFSHSRLHHLSTWKSKIRLDLAPHLLTLTPQKQRARHYILHADLDSFFASVTLLTRPTLRTKPVAIAHGAHDSTGGSEIAACNYPARSFGLKAGMWLPRAKALCPELTVLGYEFAKYEEASRAFYGVVKRVGAERIHAGSVDEVLLDVSNLVCDVGLQSIAEEEEAVMRIAEGLRGDVRAATGGLEVSVGVGGNVLLAKLALRRAKPAGVFFVRAAEVAGFMDGVEVGELPGVGPSVVGRVAEAFGTGRVAEIRGVARERLKSVLGEKTGTMLFEYCRAVDARVVGEVAVRKSLSVDVNWGVRFETPSQSEHFLHQLSTEVSTRLHSERLHGRHLTLTIKQRSPHAPFKPAKHLGHGECTTLTRSTLLPAPTASPATIAHAAVAMLRAMKVPAWELRGLGLTLTKLQAAVSAGAGGGGGQGLLKFAKAEPAPAAEGSSSKGEAAATKAAANVPPWGDRPLPKAYSRPKPASLLDTFLTKPKPTKTPTRPVPVEPESEAATPATQFEIPEDIDESVIPFLPAALQARIREKQRLAAQAQARAEPEKKNVEKEQEAEREEDPLSQPPNSQDDITVWRALPADIRALLRSEHAAEQARLSAASSAATSPHKPKAKAQERQKHHPHHPHTPRKSHPLPRLPWERSTPTPSPATTPNRNQPPTTAGPSNPHPHNAPILDAHGTDVSHWLFTTGGIDASYFHALPPLEQRHTIALGARTHRAHLAAEATRARRAAAEAARMAGALRLQAREEGRRRRVLDDGTRVGSVAEVKDFARGVVGGGRGEEGWSVLAGVLRGMMEEGAVAEVEEVVRFVGVLGEVGEGWEVVVEGLGEVVGGRLGGV